jgi:magnesium-transporting ATPase (P-type)
MEIEQVVKELNTDLHQGLSVEEARRRLVISGYNELKSVDQPAGPPHDPSYPGLKTFSRTSPVTFDLREGKVLLALLIEVPIFFFLFYQKFTDITEARTEIFFLFVIIELIIALNFRSMKYSIFKAPPHKWLIVAIAWEVIMIAVLIQFPSVLDAFGISIPSVTDLGIILALGAVIFISMEILKAILRRNVYSKGRAVLLHTEPSMN